jgi:hypothetical protein
MRLTGCGNSPKLMFAPMTQDCTSFIATGTIALYTWSQLSFAAANSSEHFW